MPPKRQNAASGSSQPAQPAPAPPRFRSPVPTAALTSLSSGHPTLKSNSSPVEIAHHVWLQYLATTPQRTLLLDAFMGFLIVVGGIQFVYCVLAGNYPFNAFLSGFSAAVGQFVLTVSLRMQTSSSSSSNNNNNNQDKAAKGPKPTSSTGKSAKGADGEEHDGSMPAVSHERAFADFIFGSLILHFFCINFIN